MLGLATIPISVAPEWTERGPVWWKLGAALRVVEAGRSLVWTDDDLSYYRRDLFAADDLYALDRREDTLLISVDPRTGLAPADLDAIAAFVDLEPEKDKSAAHPSENPPHRRR
ncbi:MAG: hypothetical protein ACRDNJ_07390 [Solirubrobacteraceae bacterium]